METDHLIIRRFVCDDFQDFSNLICDKMRSRYADYDEQFPADHENVKALYRGKGFAIEVVVEIMRYAHETLNVRKMISGTAEENEPSVKLLLKTGFSLVEKSKGSFVNDKKGNPIIFTGCSFEYIF